MELKIKNISVTEIKSDLLIVNLFDRKKRMQSLLQACNFALFVRYNTNTY